MVSAMHGEAAKPVACVEPFLPSRRRAPENFSRTESAPESGVAPS